MAADSGERLHTGRGPAQDMGGEGTEEKARRLGRDRRRLFLLSTAVSLAWLVLLWRSGLSQWLWSVLLGAVAGFWPAVALYLAVFFVLYALVLLPLSYYGGYVVQHRYGLSRQSLGQWLVDWAKGLVLSLLLGVIAGWAFYFVVRRFPADWWWIYATFLAIGIVLLTYLTPYVIVPLFFKMRPIEDPALVERIQELARRAGAEVTAVCSLDFSRRTVEGNAAVMGFGPSRRVVISDTLLQRFPPEEIEAVVAHELGHHVKGDVWAGIAMSLATVYVGMALARLALQPAMALLNAGDFADVANFPVLVLLASLYSLLTMPILNAISRRLERRADLFAIQLLGRPRAFASAMRRLARQNLIEFSPPRWAELLLYTHPSIERRVRMAEQAAQG